MWRTLLFEGRLSCQLLPCEIEAICAAIYGTQASWRQGRLSNCVPRLRQMSAQNLLTFGSNMDIRVTSLAHPMKPGRALHGQWRVLGAQPFDYKTATCLVQVASCATKCCASGPRRCGNPRLLKGRGQAKESHGVNIRASSLTMIKLPSNLPLHSQGIYTPTCPRLIGRVLHGVPHSVVVRDDMGRRRHRHVHVVGSAGVALQCIKHC